MAVGEEFFFRDGQHCLVLSSGGWLGRRSERDGGGGGGGQGGGAQTKDRTGR